MRIKGRWSGSPSADRDALKVVTSISNGRPIFVATCNSIERLNTALLRRFPLTFYFDLPDREERAKIWPIHGAHGLTSRPRPMTACGAGRTSATAASWLARRVLLVESAGKGSCRSVFVRRRRSTQLRQQANGRFLSASYPGVYRQVQQDVPSKGRKLDVA